MIIDRPREGRPGERRDDAVDQIHRRHTRGPGGRGAKPVDQSLTQQKRRDRAQRHRHAEPSQHSGNGRCHDVIQHPPSVRVLPVRAPTKSPAGG